MGYNRYDEGCLQLQTSSSFSGTLHVVFTIRNFRYSQEAAEVS